MSESLADVVHEAVERAKADEERKPVTLTEFLLARITEDEDRVRDETPHWADCDSFIMFSEGGLPCNLGCEERLLAECEAKRRIVEAYGRADDDYEACNYWPGPEDQGFLSGLETAVNFLAQPHAEHPDFDPSWRL